MSNLPSSIVWTDLNKTITPSADGDRPDSAPWTDNSSLRLWAAEFASYWQSALSPSTQGMVLILFYTVPLRLVCRQKRSNVCGLYSFWLHFVDWFLLWAPDQVVQGVADPVDTTASQKCCIKKMSEVIVYKCVIKNKLKRSLKCK